MPFFNDKSTKEFRRALRANPTHAEKALWNALRGNNAGAKFRRQESVGNYVLDFYCPELRLCVEVDGASHEGREAYDLSRDKELRQNQVTILRFTDSEVMSLPEQTLMKIKETIVEMRLNGKSFRAPSTQLSNDEKLRLSVVRGQPPPNPRLQKAGEKEGASLRDALNRILPPSKGGKQEGASLREAIK